MTATRSLTCFITARSWEMNTIVRPSRRLISSSRFRICACTDTSSDETGSSQMSSFGSSMRARAMLMRWHWPPENSLGRRLPWATGSMPTASSIDAARRPRSARSATPQMARGSATTSRIRRRGLSDEIGS